MLEQPGQVDHQDPLDHEEKEGQQGQQDLPGLLVQLGQQGREARLGALVQEDRLDSKEPLVLQVLKDRLVQLVKQEDQDCQETLEREALLVLQVQLAHLAQLDLLD